MCWTLSVPFVTAVNTVRYPPYYLFYSLTFRIIYRKVYIRVLKFQSAPSYVILARSKNIYSDSYLRFAQVGSDSGTTTQELFTTLFRYVQLPADEVDTQLLQDATRKEAAQNKQ